MGTSAEEAKNMIGNRYEMVIVASLRVRELRRGAKTLLSPVPKNGFIVTALKEIEAGLVGRDYLKKVNKHTQNM